jgi:hypothetical protein
MTLSEAADMLPMMQLSRFGAVLPVDQVDLVETEDGRIGAYIYDCCENCIMIVFDKPDLDPDQVRDVLLQPRVVHC